MKEEVRALLAGGGNYIGTYNEIKIDTINAEHFYLNEMPGVKHQSSGEPERMAEEPTNKEISEDIIPEKLKPIYGNLDAKKQLIVLAIVYLQMQKDRNEYLFRFDNDWWGIYSPLVYDEDWPRDLGTFYSTLEELGMGYYHVNCTRDRMTKINGVFLKDYRKWTASDYYGERDWVFRQKRKIATKFTEILKQLHNYKEI